MNGKGGRSTRPASRTPPTLPAGSVVPQNLDAEEPVLGAMDAVQLLASFEAGVARLRQPCCGRPT
jgi:hypothetical protein